MRIGELLDAAINLYRRNWKTFMGIVATIIVPFTFIQQFAIWSASRSGVEPGAGRVVTLLAVVALGFLVIQPFLTAALVRVSSEFYLGRAPTFEQTYRFALGRTRSILWVTILAALATMGGFVLLVIPGILVYFRLLFGPAIVVMEGKRGREALGRSWRLAKGHFWKIFGTVVLAGILFSVVNGILTIPTNLIGSRIESGGWVIIAAGASLAAVITNPALTIVTVLVYFDLRIRKEGFDIALMAQELAQNSGAQ